MCGVIYFLHDGTDAVKIGHTTQAAISKRIAGLQTGNPRRIELIASIPAEKKTEHRLHGLLKEHRLIGEWYRRDEVISAVVVFASRYDSRMVVDISVLHEIVSDAVLVQKAEKEAVQTFAGRLMRCRKRLGLAPEEVWPNIKIVLEIESGRLRTVSDYIAEAMAAKLAVNTKWLTRGVGEEEFGQPHIDKQEDKQQRQATTDSPTQPSMPPRRYEVSLDRDERIAGLINGYVDASA